MENPFNGLVEEHMVAPVATIRDDEFLAAARALLEQLQVSALPVIDGSQRLVGLIGWSHLLRAGKFRPERAGHPRQLWLPELRVSAVMDGSVPVLRRHYTLSECARRMLDQRIHRLYVAEDGPLEGVVSTRELLSAVEQARVEAPLSEIMHTPLAVVECSESVGSASARLRENSALAVVDGGRVVGLFTRLEARYAVEAEPNEAVGLWMNDSVIALSLHAPLHVAAERLLLARARHCVAVARSTGEDANAPDSKIEGWAAALDFAKLARARAAPG